MKKILIVSARFWPENSPRAFRATELAKELGRKGHAVTVLTAFKEELQDFKADNVNIKNFGVLRLKNIKFGSSIIARAINRALQLLFDFPNIEIFFKVRKALKDETGYDALISIAVPHPTHWGVASVWNKKKIAKIWIADSGDPYMIKENDSFGRLFYFKFIERWSYNKTNYLTIPTENSIKLYEEFVRPKIRVISQGFDVSQFPKPVPNSTDEVRLGYAGSFIPGIRDPREFCEYLIENYTNYKFYIFTSTPMCVKEVEAKSKGNIIVNGIIPRHELLDKFSKLDFVVNVENESEAQVPSKLIDYAFLEKPILSIKYKKLNTKVVDEFMQKKYQNQYVVKNKEQYNIRNVADKFLELMTS